MDIHTTVSSILDYKRPGLWSVDPDSTVFDAISMMAEKNVGALPVMKAGRLLGMISERDYTRKIVLRGRASRETKVGDIMTDAVLTVGPQELVVNCMQMMTDNHVRHLPVMEDSRVIGIVSIGDLVNWIIGVQANTIDDLERFVTGAYPG
jgi:CBS domain-containing protein